MIPIFNVTSTRAGQAPATLPKDLVQDLKQDKDNHCYFCGFHSTKHQVVFLDGDPYHQDEHNLVLADCFCAAWQQLNTLSDEVGELIYLPDVSPAQLNHINRTLAVLFQSQNEQNQKIAQRVFNYLLNHKNEIEKLLGFSQPSGLTAIIKRLPQEQRMKLPQTLKNVGLLISPNAFSVSDFLDKKSHFDIDPIDLINHLREKL